VNIRALRSRDTDGEALARVAEVARLLTGRADADAEAAVAWLESVVHALAIPPLSTYGVAAADLPAIAAQAAQASSMKTNPIALTADELTEIVAGAL
jgi:alcohol dehydrogenase class IV